jgi:glycosyltransferase involved in cell wall biosynthesis
VRPGAIHVLLPGPPETPTGGFVYDRHMVRTLRRAGRLASVLVIPGTWPDPAPATIAAAAGRVAGLPDGAALLVDGLAFSPLLEVFEDHRDRLRLIALVHHPLADEVGPDDADYGRFFDREGRALALAHGVVVTSATTACRLADFDVPENKIRVVKPGVAGRAFGVRRPSGMPPILLCVASLTPRKGQEILLRALARLRRLDWRLRLVGPERDPAFARRVRRLARAFSLADRVELTGALASARLPQEYRAADLFILPSYHEGFGMVVAEAAAHGLPIVASGAGAIAEAAAGSRHRLVAPDDPRALAHALRLSLTSEQVVIHRSKSRPRSWEDAGRELLAALDAFGIR